MIGNIRKHAFGEPAPTPVKKVLSYPEADAQRRVVMWLRKRNDVLVMRLENALRRTPAQAVRDRAMGMEAGAPDLVLACLGRIIFVEMKAKRGQVSDEQQGIHNVLRAMGHTVLVCHGHEEAIFMLTTVLDGGSLT